MPTLTVTINGPFAYVNNYPDGKFLTLMAPMCSQHRAGIATIEEGEQYVLTNCNRRNHPANHGGCDSHKYELKIQAGDPSSTVWVGDYLSCPKPSNDWEAKDWRFWLQLPKPNVIFAANPVVMHVIHPNQGSSDTVVEGKYAIGARLIYENWDGGPIPLWYKNGPIQYDNHDVIFHFKSCGEGHGILEIDYTGPLRDDSDHEDAVDCFESLMRGLGLPWTIFIPALVPQTTGSGGMGIEAGKLNDCKAAIARVG
jgi:hypothetical protein